MGQFGQLLNADAAVPKHLNGRPGPKGPVFFESEVASPAAGWVLGPDVGAVRAGGQYPPEPLPAGGEHLTGAGGLRGGEAVGGRRALCVDRGGQGG